MARKLAHDADTESGRSPDSDSSGARWHGILDRREYVRLTVATVITTLVAITSLTGPAAASKSTSKSGSDGSRHYLLLEGSGDLSKYEFTVDGDIEPGSSAVEDASARISGCSAEGVIEDGSRGYRISGEVRDFNADGDVDVTFRRAGPP